MILLYFESKLDKNFFFYLKPNGITISRKIVKKYKILLILQEKRGRHFLDDKRERDAKIAAEKAKKRKSRTPSPESEELKRLKRMKEIQDLVVKEEEKYVAEPLDPNLFEWDDK